MDKNRTYDGAHANHQRNQDRDFMNLRHRSTTNIPPYRVSRYLACHVPRLAVSKAASRATALAQTIPAQGSRLHKRIIASGGLIMIWLQVRIDPNNSQGLNMIKEVDIA